MKIAALFASLVVGSFLLAPQAQAGKVGKLAGNYTGGGTFTDKRSAPISTYLYTFTNLVVKVKGNGKLSGSSTVTAAISSGGSPFMTITSGTVSVTGTVEDIKITKAKTTATGELAFSDGSRVAGTFSVATKTGKGKFVAKESNAQFDVDFTVSKKK